MINGCRHREKRGVVAFALAPGKRLGQASPHGSPGTAGHDAASAETAAPTVAGVQGKGFGRAGHPGKHLLGLDRGHVGRTSPVDLGVLPAHQPPRVIVQHLYVGLLQPLARGPRDRQQARRRPRRSGDPQPARAPATAPAGKFGVRGSPGTGSTAGLSRSCGDAGPEALAQLHHRFGRGFGPVVDEPPARAGA